MLPQREENRPPEGQKSSQDRPGGSQERPKSAQEFPKSAQERPKSAQERPTSVQERPKSAPRAPQEHPRAPREPPRAPQERPKSAQERPKSAQESLSDAFCSATRSRSAFGTIFVRFSRRARKSGRVKKLSKPMVLHRFLQVFRMSALVRASRPTRSESNRKIAKIDPLGDPKSTQVRPKSFFGALFEALRAAKSIEEPSSSDLGATWSVEKACQSDW